MSNWENRPLRQSQQHYALLDAYSLILMHNALIKEAGSNGEELLKKCMRNIDPNKKKEVENK